LGFVHDANAEDIKQPPVIVDFYPNKVGNVYTFDLSLETSRTVAITVNFYITLPLYLSKPGRSYFLWHFFDKESPEEARRLSDLLGSARKIMSGQWVESGVPAKFRVKIFQKTNEKLILDKIVDHPKTLSVYMGRYANLVDKYTLLPGVYTVRIEYLEGAPELAPLYGKILFSRAYTGK